VFWGGRIFASSSFSTSLASDSLVTGMNNQRPSLNCGASWSIREIFSPSSSCRGALSLGLAEYDLRKDPFLLWM
jgi:hypothetical protein